MSEIKKMQVVIAMSGFGERFRRAGYTIPKPLIEIDDFPIIKYVVDMFPGVDDILFICNRDHLDDKTLNLQNTLKKLRPNGKIISINPHKLGPVEAVLQASKYIDLDRPTIINYCDFSCFWDFAHFSNWVAENQCSGAVVAYTGFHPHMLESTNYAYVKETNGWVADIQEKKPFTSIPMNEYASSGTYYFNSGQLALKYCKQVKQEELSLNGEFYVSLVYKPMLKDNLPIAVYPIQHFMQWGTPSDLKSFQKWSDTFSSLAKNNFLPAQQIGSVMVPLAGAGSRFLDTEFKTPKPLIKVSGRAMAIQAANDLPKAPNSVFIMRKDFALIDKMEAELVEEFPNKKTVLLDGLSNGQAISCMAGLDCCDLDTALTIGACDNGLLYDKQKFEALMSDSTIDVIVWGVRGHENACLQPKMYGWIDETKNKIKHISVKEPLDSPETDPIVVGTFSFKRAKDFKKSVLKMVERNGLVNGEFYVDTCINDAVELGLNCVLFEVEYYLSWGTPNELRTFNYWQSCFHKWENHPYKLKKDIRVTESSIGILEKWYQAVVPSILS